MVLPARTAIHGQTRAAETLDATPASGLPLLASIDASVLPLLLLQRGDRLRVVARRAAGQDEHERVAEGSMRTQSWC
jgi:hypothetical protein